MSSLIDHLWSDDIHTYMITYIHTHTHTTFPLIDWKEEDDCRVDENKKRGERIKRRWRGGIQRTKRKRVRGGRGEEEEEKKQKHKEGKLVSITLRTFLKLCPRCYCWCTAAWLYHFNWPKDLEQENPKKISSKKSVGRILTALVNQMDLKPKKIHLKDNIYFYPPKKSGEENSTAPKIYNCII